MELNKNAAELNLLIMQTFIITIINTEITPTLKQVNW